MSTITDKELLAICNLSNLKLEFANLKKGKEHERIEENHTIYSLLDQEYRSIYGSMMAKGTEKEDLDEDIEEITVVESQEGKVISENGKDVIQIEAIEEKKIYVGRPGRVFYKHTNERDITSKKIPIYNDILELKKEAGIVYEYYEKLRDYGNEEGQFLNEWKILYAGDGYKIMS